MTTLLSRRATLQAALETTYNTPVSVANTDAILVNNPMFTVTPNVLERDFTRNDLSQLPFIIGRKIAKIEFETELRGNGKEGTGLLASAPVIARLFQACGFTLAGKPGVTTLGPYQTNDQTNPITWSTSSGHVASDVLTFTGIPSNGDTVTVGSQTYTFKTTLTPAANEVLIGGSEANAIANLAAAINLATGSGTTYGGATTKNAYVSAAYTTTTLTASAFSQGTYGNSIGATATSSACTWATSTLTSGTNVGSNTTLIAYYLNVTTGGASGAAQVTITSDTTGEGSGPVTLTSGSPLTVGTQGLTLTPTWSGSLVAGQRWVAWLLPPGLQLQPVSTGISSVTIFLNKDSVQHQMPGAIGTFDITAEAGQYAKIKWTFTGTYVAPIDSALPTNLVFEQTLPHQIELARLQADDFPAIVAKFTYNQGNDIQPRMDVNAADGYLGVRLVSRKPEGGFDPESDNVANHDFWGRMAAAQRMPFQMAIGTATNNIIWFLATNSQYSGLTYQDRNGILTYQAGLRFARQNGDDEVFIHFA